MQTRIKVAVLGSATQPEDSDAGRRAFAVGKAVAERNGVLLTGGCWGLPHAAAMGAASAGGMTVAVSPAMNARFHQEAYAMPLDSMVMLFTGMGAKGRNVILVRSADACLFVGGGTGTLNEFTIAYDELSRTCAIGVLENSGGLSDEYLRIGRKAGRAPAAYVTSHRDPERLVGELLDHVASP